MLGRMRGTLMLVIRPPQTALRSLAVPERPTGNISRVPYPVGRLGHLDLPTVRMRLPNMVCVARQQQGKTVVKQLRYLCVKYMYIACDS